MKRSQGHRTRRSIVRRRLLQGLLGSATATTTALPWLAGPARAQPAAWPSRPITLVVPWPAGNPSDAFARRLQPMLSRVLGQPVIVENIAGAGGSLGAARVAAAPADGHTLLIGTPTELVLSPQTMPSVRYKPQDFSLITSFGRSVYVLTSRADLPQATLADLLAHKGRAGAKPLSIGHIGPGSLIQLMSLQFQKVSGLDLTLVPYRGVPPMVQDLLGSQLDLGFLPLAGTTHATLEQGRLRAFGVTASAPPPLFPAMKTLAAGSRAFEGFDFDVWGGLLVRRETPAALQQQLHQVMADAVREPEFVAWARSTGSDPLPLMDLAALQAFYPAEVARYSTLLRAFPQAGQ